MIGNLLERLFVAVGADVSEFNEEMSAAVTDTVKQTGKIAKAWDRLGDVVGPAFSKIGDLAKVAIDEAGEVLKDGLVEGLTAGGAAFTAKAAEGDLWGGLTDGIDAAISVGAASITQGFADQILPALLEQVDLVDLAMKGFGGLGSALSGLVPILGAVGKAMMGLMLSPLGLILAAIAAVVAVWYYWDEIVEIVEKVGKVVSDWYSKNIKPTMDKVLATIQPVVDFFKDVFGAQIEAVIDFVSALIKGDFKGAWEAAKKYVMVSVDAVLKILSTLGTVAIDAFAGIYRGAKQWLQDKLGAIFNWVSDKLSWAGDQFYKLWDRVVGHSYIPDMVDGIADHIGRLEGVMVKPIELATKASGDAFEKLKGRVGGLLDQLFPNQAKARELEEKYETLDKALAEKLISPRVYAEARDRLNKELEKLEDIVLKENSVLAPGTSLITPEMEAQFQRDLEELSTIFTDDFEEPFLDSADRIANGIADMVVDVDASLRGLVSSIKDGDIIGIITGIADTIVSIIGAIKGISGGFGGSDSGSSPPGRATGGRVAPFSTFTVGENGPEVLRTGPDGGRVYNNNDTKKMMGGGANDNGRVAIELGIEASEYFDGRVMKVTQPGMTQAAHQGALGGHAITIKESRRNANRRIPG